MPDKKKSRDASAAGSFFSPGLRERYIGNTKTNDEYLNPNMPKDTPVMRAPSARERIMDAIGGLGESISQQPLVRILGSLNRDLGGEAPPPMDLPGGGKAEWKIGMMPGNPSRGMLGGKLAPDVEMMHPAVPPEFHAVNKPRMPQSRTAPIDMENLPSGKIEYLDPDVAEYMNPKGLDVTTKEGQRRLRFLTGK